MVSKQRPPSPDTLTSLFALSAGGAACAVCQVPTGGAGRGRDPWGAAETKPMGASATPRLVQLFGGQDLPPLIFQPQEQIGSGMRSEFVGEFTEPCPVF